MFTHARLGCLLLVILICASVASAQQQGPSTQLGDGSIYLDVVVTPKSGPPVAGLQQQDFTLLDNKVARPIASFKAFERREAPVEALLVIDAVNTSAQIVMYERTEIDKLLRSEGGHLTYPIALAVMTDTGIQILGDFSQDGTSLSASLDHDDIGLRDLGRFSGYNGAAERLQISLEAMRQLVGREASRPGRKVVLFVSPGWPLLSGPNTQLFPKQQDQIFGEIVSISTQLLQARVTLYSVDPLGSGQSVIGASYYKNFVKGVSKPSQVQIGDLALPVLAIQSGGLAFTFSNDITGLLRTCIADAAPYYEISFVPPQSDQRNEYHRLEIKIAKLGLTARTRQGYYAQP